MNGFLKFLMKVEQCGTFEGKKNQFGLVKKKLCYPDYSF
jgi:hypothetical protein